MILRLIDCISEWSGRLVAWLVLLLAVLVGIDVALRALFSFSRVWINELEWHLFGLIILLGAAWTLRHDGHVRVDLLGRYRWAGERFAAWRDLIGHLVLLLPLCGVVIYASWDWVVSAWTFAERSPYPDGLPYRFLLKAAIPLGFALLALQAVAESVRDLRFLLGYSEVRR